MSWQVWTAARIPRTAAVAAAVALSFADAQRDSAG